MNEFHRRLQNGPTLLLDGGLGSMMIARGLPPGSPPDRWNLERPDEVLRIHREYVAAGSEAVHSNTFGSNPIRLARFGLEHSCRRINEAGVRLARESGAPFVIGDIGPTGELLPPLGNGDSAAWAEGFRMQARILADSGVDALHIETMSDLREALLALASVQESSPGLPVLVSLTFGRTRRGFFTVMGNPLIESLASLADAGAAAVGANCTVESADMLELAKLALRSVTARLVFQPNAGQPRIDGDRVIYDQDARTFARAMAPLAGQGAIALGGCCGTDPGFIAALRSMLAGPPSTLSDARR